MKLGVGCKVNGVKVFEMDVKSYPDSLSNVQITYALAQLDEVGGELKLVGTHGKATANHTNLSEKSKALLDELIQSMETDLLPRHFDGSVDKEDQNEQGLELRGHEETPQI
jgi:hypothetical protein